MATYYRFDGWVKTTLGPAVAGAQVYVCSQPTTDIVDIPPVPFASIFSDNAGLHPVVQPLVTDGFGHYFFYALQGFYTIVIVNNGIIQEVLPDQALGHP